MKVARRIICSFCLISLIGAPIDKSVAQSLVVENVGIYEVTTGNVIPAQNVVILNGVISQIGASVPTRLSNDTIIFRGDGLTMMPGLTDAHVHMNEVDAGTFLANGVTSIRELNGSPDHLILRDRIAQGDVVGPRMLVSSPLISGRAIDFRHVLVESSTQAAELVDELKDAGYDYLKIYDDLNEETYRQVIDRAKKLNLEYVGHIPNAVGLEGVLAAGQSIEHNEKIVVEVLGHDFSNLEPLINAAQSIAQSGVTVTPTLAVHEFLSNRQSTYVQDRLVADEIAYVDNEIVEWWRSTFPKHDESPAHDQSSSALEFLNAQRALLIEMHNLGVPILAGTDTPNPLMIAGFSLHDELEALVRAGLTNAAAIRTATSIAGSRLPWPVRIGEVEVGFAADLVLVKGNPSSDLSILRAPTAVIANGVWLDRQQLDNLLFVSRRK